MEQEMAEPEIHQFICRSDNYGVLLRDRGTGSVASIDAPNADQVAAALAAKGWRLTHILTTHHHGDHTEGNVALKRSTGCTIIGPKGEAARVPGIDNAVGEGDTFALGGLEVRVLDTPGHTAGHVSYWLPAAKVAFVGDTLFAIGCGRVIEGTAEMMWRSLVKIRDLPGETRLYCGHEYTLANARFALTIEPENAALQARAKQVEAQRARGELTLPTTVALERETNPFLRPDSATIRKRLGMEKAQDWQVFAEVRERKNRS
jgi:hydroxyacylglutathione hydrolase